MHKNSLPMTSRRRGGSRGESLASMHVDVSRRSLIAPKTSILRRISGTDNRRNENRIIINVGGIKYETYRTTLKNIPDTRLSWLSDTTGNNPDYDPDTGEYFFDRHPGVFNMILNYYRTGKLHAPTDVCGPLFEEELAFWGLDEKQIEPCCWAVYRAHKDAQDTLAEMDGGEVKGDDEEDDGAEELENIRQKFGIIEEHVTEEKSCWERNRPRVWRLLDEPKSSQAAKVFAFVSLAFVLTSISVFCMESHILFRDPLLPDLDLSTLSVRDKELLSRPMVFLHVIEYICISFFTAEIFLRLIFCPNLKDYFRQMFNWVDIVVVLPCFLNLILIAAIPNVHGADAFRFLNALRLIRIFRIFKLTIHVSGLKILGHTIKASAKELLLLFLVLIIGVLIFACLIYYAEQVDEGKINSFSNIPKGFWWAVVTMTTLGYGDLYPRTALGYIVGTVCAVCGLLMLSLPVPVIVSNFTLYYTHAQARLKLPKKSKKKVLLSAANILVDQDSTSPGASFEGNEQTTTNRRDSLECTSSDDSAISSSYGSGKNGGHVGISVIFTDEGSEPCEGRQPGSAPSSPGRANQSSPEQPGKHQSPANLSPEKHNATPPYRKRRVSYTVTAASARRCSAVPNIHI